jgi:putative peptidoglycan lipid II flippase
MSERKQIAAAAGVVGSMTMISRVFGYLRDAVIALYFGAGTSADAFFVAFRIPNFLRRLFGEGSLTVSFVPVFTDVLENKGEKPAKELAAVAFTAFSAILSIVTVLGVIFAPQIILVLAPGYQGMAGKAELTVFLTRVMFPYVLLVCLVALAMGILNSLKHFFAPAFAPVLLNVAMILSAIGLAPRVDPPVLALAIGVLAGGVTQLAFQIPFLAKRGYIPRLIFQFNDPNLRKIGLLMVPALFGMAVHTISVFINTIFASLLAEGAVSYLFYADRLMELPLGVFAIAVGTAVLPSMSRQTARGDIEGLKDTMSYSMRLVLFITLPATAGLIALAGPIVNVLFQRGAFDFTATSATAIALIYFCVGLPFFAALRVIVPTFYSMKDTLTPVLLAVTSLVVTMICNFLFIGPVQYKDIAWIAMLTETLNITGPLGHGGLALSTSVGAVVNCTGLILILRKRIGKIDGGKIAASFGRALVASAIMGGAVYWLAGYFDFTTDGFGLAKTGGLALCIAVGLGVYVAVSALVKSRELSSMMGLITRRFTRKSNPTL